MLLKILFSLPARSLSCTWHNFGNGFSARLDSPLFLPRPGLSDLAGFLGPAVWMAIGGGGGLTFARWCFFHDWANAVVSLLIVWLASFFREEIFRWETVHLSECKPSSYSCQQLINLIWTSKTNVWNWRKIQKKCEKKLLIWFNPNLRYLHPRSQSPQKPSNAHAGSWFRCINSKWVTFSAGPESPLGPLAAWNRGMLIAYFY